MGLVQEEEEKRYFIQLALQGGKEWWNPVTCYIQNKEVIPLYENFCYVLALASSKQKENAERAQELLHRLLQFQIARVSHFKGAFPKYLHQYPYAKDHVFQSNLLLVMQELINFHSLALGRVITAQLKKAFKKLRDYLHSQEIELEPKLERKISSKELSSYLLPLRMTNTPLQQELLEKYSRYWNPDLGCYTGPALEEYYIESSLKRSTFDYLMASYYHVYPTWLKETSLLQLQGALVPYSPEAKMFTYERVDGEFHGNSFSIWNTPSDSLFLFHSFSPETQSGGLHLLRYIWKNQDELFHLACQSTHMQMEATHDDTDTSLIFTYPQEVSEDHNHSVELEFFVNYHPELKWSVDTKKATVFYMGDTITLHAPNRTLEFVFSIEGEGEIVGHISRGNRPSQIDPKAIKEHQAFDWRLSLRTLRRGSTLKLKLAMKSTSLLSGSQIQESLERLPLHVDHCLHIE